ETARSGVFPGTGEPSFGDGGPAAAEPRTAAATCRSHRIRGNRRQQCRQVAPTDIPVLILGENGTGKELIARAIHTHSKRRKNRMVTMNCAGFAPTILEDEMFGHVRGAYTGANTDREGRFEHADHGTLFLDEI